MSKIIFKVIDSKQKKIVEPYTAYLEAVDWNDYWFYTHFDLHVYDQYKNHYKIGGIKIGFFNQKDNSEDSTFLKLPKEFEKLSNDFFSIGGYIDFYKNLMKINKKIREDILTSLNDISLNQKIFYSAKNESVFRSSLMRDTHYDEIGKLITKYRNILSGGKELTDYNFAFLKQNEDGKNVITLEFEVKVGSNPPTNMHAIIGKNGVGKTTILNNMVQSILGNAKTCYFVEVNPWIKNEDKRFDIHNKIDKYYFSNLISVSYSAFDPFKPNENQLDPSKGTSYHYIGLKKPNETLKSSAELRREFIAILDDFLEDGRRKIVWYEAVKSLNEDVNLLDIYFSSADNDVDTLIRQVKDKLDTMSSGHTILLLIITHLVKSLKEKSLVLIDEPESHLHPPLLSAFIRTISSLLLKYNAVSIIATHSPVVLQEIPKSCVTRIERYGEITNIDRPKIETFAESVDTLTQDIFGLEFENSGFFKILKEASNSKKSFQEIVEEFDHQIGEEGLFILKSLLKNRDYNVQD